MKIGQIKTNDNKKLLIIVSILIVLGISGSFAYFLNRQGVLGVGSKTDVTTATLGSSTIKIEGTLNFNDLDILPGHKNILAIKLTATGDNELISYNLIWKGTNTLNTPLNYTVYKTTNKIDTTSTCKKVTKVENGKQILSEECSISNLNQLGSAIATGTIETSNSESKIVLIEDEMITATTDGDIKYYYIILEYPNLDSNQNSDIGGSFDGTLTIEKGNTKPDVNIMAVYTKGDGDADYVKSDDIPSSTSGLGFNKSKSNCTNDATPIWNSSSWNITIDNLTKSGTSCYLYFDKENDGIGIDTIITSWSGSTTNDSMFTGITGDGIYTWTKGDYSGGTQPIKYFRGNVDNNWVVFGKDGPNYIWWRIIRNNSNGSLRMIYAGTSSSKTLAPVTTGSRTQIGTNLFNSFKQAALDNMYVGFKYTSGQVHGNDTNSTILGEETSTDKATLYGWYNATLGTSSDYFGKIDLNAGFCNDRQPSSTTSSLDGIGGTGTTPTSYAARIRLERNKAPSLLCENGDDIFKTPVGLITADEVSMGGMINGSQTTSSYLYTNSYYWTISPYMGAVTGDTSVFFVRQEGYLSSSPTNNSGVSIGVRPVINLKADTPFEEGGNGTSNSPYVVIGT